MQRIRQTNQTPAFKSGVTKTAETWRFCTCERVWNVKTAGMKTNLNGMECFGNAVSPSPLLHMAACVHDHRVKYTAWLFYTAAQSSHQLHIHWWKQNHVHVFYRRAKSSWWLVSKPTSILPNVTSLHADCSKILLWKTQPFSEPPPQCRRLPLQPRLAGKTTQHFPQI